mmetsp:Transcript_23451/g.69068  ORF Transcript_23451/g.69068 Transcript_23451/m.69068 type:complete len:213 (-) Transcript_23451:293-931(-)
MRARPRQVAGCSGLGQPIGCTNGDPLRCDPLGPTPSDYGSAAEARPSTRRARFCSCMLRSRASLAAHIGAKSANASASARTTSFAASSACTRAPCSSAARLRSSAPSARFSRSTSRAQDTACARAATRAARRSPSTEAWSMTARRWRTASRARPAAERCSGALGSGAAGGTDPAASPGLGVTTGPGVVTARLRASKPNMSEVGLPLLTSPSK